jgi:outer membrane protein assembly factor BamB
VLMNGIAYFPNTNGMLYSFPLLGTGLFNTTPTIGSTTPFPGAMLMGSINGTSNAILWATTPDSTTILGSSTGELVALNAATLATIWSSGTNSADALIGGPNKFLSPTVANGKVYVPTYGGNIVVYGLYSPTTLLIGELHGPGKAQPHHAE